MFKSLNTLSGDSFACLDFVDLGFDDIMGEETAADPPPLEKEDHDDMSPETEEEGDIISDIERIQRALTGIIRDYNRMSKPPLIAILGHLQILGTSTVSNIRRWPTCLIQLTLQGLEILV